MCIRNPIFKMIAAALALSLVLVGAVPAMSVCKRAWGYCKECRNPFHSSDVLLKEFKLDQLHVGLIGVSHNSHRFLPHLNTSFPDHRWHKEIETASCDMEPSRSIDSIQGSGPKVPRAKRPLPNTLVSLMPDLSPGDRTSTGLTSGWLPTARAAPIPIYILTLTFLC